jgi:threonine dehydrogenase-like Zn-dependent dehydrogenase
MGAGHDGMLAEYVLLPEFGLVRIPEHLSFEEDESDPFALVLQSWPYKANISFFIFF